MEKIILKIFNLQDIECLFKDCKVIGAEIILEFAETKQAICPRRSLLSRSRHPRGKVRKIYHGYGFGRKVYLKLRKSRYFCKRCGKAFY